MDTCPMERKLIDPKALNHLNPLNPLNRRSPAFYRHYAELFHEYFPDVDSGSLKLLNRAGVHCYNASLNMDSLLDEGDRDSLGHILNEYGASVRLLAGLFEDGEQFWELWAKRQREFLESVVLEKRLVQTRTVEFSQYELLSELKSAPAKLAIDALYLLSRSDGGIRSTYELLLDSHAHFSSALQLYDDLVDMKEDFGQGRFNWVLYAYTSRRSTEQNPLEQERVLKEFYLNRDMDHVFRRIGNLLEKALDGFDRDTLWTRTIRLVQDTISGYRDQSNGYVEIVYSRHRMISTRYRGGVAEGSRSLVGVNGQPQHISQGFSFLDLEYRKGWPGLRHYMYFSGREGFGHEAGVHSSDIFFRAIMACFLSGLKERLAISRDYLESEIQYFLQNRQRESPGAWSYFPTLKSLSADLDDMAEVMRFFHRMGRRDLLEPHCTGLLAEQLDRGSDSRGLMYTWLLPRESSSRNYNRQEEFNRRKWGKGPHPEVLANIADSLLDYAPELHERIKDGIAQYLLRTQSDKGCWRSRWYHGFPYGNLLVIRYLNRSGQLTAEARSLWMKYLRRSWNRIDGGFGLNPESPSDPLSTAFSLLTLEALELGTIGPALSARDYLIGSQMTDGGWAAIPFVEPRPGQYFKSRTLTTSYALEALISGQSNPPRK